MQLHQNAFCLQTTFSVSNKNFKKAVDRNKIKREMREAYRLQKASLISTLQMQEKNLAVFIIYTDKKLPEFEDVFKKMGYALKKINEIILT